MGFSEKAQVVEGGFESDNSSSRKWVIAGIALRAPLKPIYTTTTTTTTPFEKEQQKEDGETTTEECSTTPTGEESRIPTTFTCPPPAPRKRKPPLKCNYRGVVREFFTPPDLETVFIRHVERAS